MRQQKSPVKLSAKAVTGYVLLGITLSVHLITLVISFQANLFPATADLMTIVSTCAEIIAGLYGITAAGYTFFLSRIDALMAQDMTLDYIVSSLKNRFKYLMWFITANVMMTLFISIFLMYWPVPEQPNNVFFYRFFCNEFLISVGSSTILILYYGLQVVNPNALAREARKLKRKLSHSLMSAGDPMAFIASYDRIEQLCNSMIEPAVLSQIHENKGKRFEYTIELLARKYPMQMPLLLDVTKVHRYYECTVNCSPIAVTNEMCDLAQNVIRSLEQLSSVPSETM